MRVGEIEHDSCCFLTIVGNLRLFTVSQLRKMSCSPECKMFAFNLARISIVFEITWASSMQNYHLNAREYLTQRIMLILYTIH